VEAERGVGCVAIAHAKYCKPHWRAM